MPLHPQVIIEQFEKWDPNFVGPITPMSRKKMYSLVCIDYITKWAEDKTLLKANEQSVAHFICEDIFIQFGVP
jgi:hypothetical protein